MLPSVLPLAVFCLLLLLGVNTVNASSSPRIILNDEQAHTSSGSSCSYNKMYGFCVASASNCHSPKLTLTNSVASKGCASSDAGCCIAIDQINPSCGTAAHARAEQWVDFALQYCQSPQGKPDPDGACSKICQRNTTNAMWDAYRSDCSALVSWAYGLPAPGLTTRDFAPWGQNTSLSRVISPKELAIGDVINSTPREHIMVFSHWLDASMSEIALMEEPGCSVDPPHASWVYSPVTHNDDGTITVHKKNKTFYAVRLSTNEPPC